MSNMPYDVVDYNDEDVKSINDRDPWLTVPQGTFRVIIKGEKHLTELSTQEKTANCPQMQLLAVVLSNPEDPTSETQYKMTTKVQFPLANAPGVKIDKQAKAICAGQFRRLAPEEVPARPTYQNKVAVFNGEAVSEEEDLALKEAQNKASLDFATRLWRGKTSLKGRLYYVDVVHNVKGDRTFANMNNIREKLADGETVSELP